MKRLLALMVLVLIVFVVMERQRLYLRDPLGTVTRNGAKVGGVMVMINYSNDVLMDDKSKGEERLYLVQHWSNAVGVPSAPLKCIYGMACLTDADRASVTALPRGRALTMTDREIDFMDEDGVAVKVTLR